MTTLRDDVAGIVVDEIDEARGREEAGTVMDEETEEGWEGERARAGGAGARTGVREGVGVGVGVGVREDAGAGVGADEGEGAGAGAGETEVCVGNASSLRALTLSS